MKPGGQNTGNDAGDSRTPVPDLEALATNTARPLAGMCKATASALRPGGESRAQAGVSHEA
ncbi:hypothetical protein WDZ92_51760, partial [Nostoc sp. NIES-2111]